MKFSPSIFQLLSCNSFKVYTLSIALVIMASFFSCSNDDDATPTNSNTQSISDTFGSQTSRSFLGTVVDSSNNPLSNVSVSIGNSFTVTDNNGVFRINNATVYEKFGYVRAEKEGYINGSRSVVPTNGVNRLKIMLLDKSVTATISSGSLETVSLLNGASVTFNGDFIKEDGTPYTGNVNVSMHLLDPTNPDMESQMPGMLYGANTNNQGRMLTSYGMLAVTLEGVGGESLNINSTSPAEIKMPLDASLLSNAPSTIPLWYFDETKGYWIEEGVATLVGNTYIGEVTHFSFWNCDIPAEAINLCLTVTNDNSDLLSNLTVNITSDTYGTRSGVTNNNGEVCGLVPSNETLTIEVLDYDVCGNNPIYSSTIGPFSSDSSESITVPSTVDFATQTVIGEFTDCDGNLVDNGYVALTYGNQTFIEEVTNGAFSVNLVSCSEENTFALAAFDLTSLETTGEISYTFSSTSNTNVGVLASCDAITEFIQYTIDNSEDTLFLLGITANFTTTQNNYLSISANGSDSTTGDCFYLMAYLNNSPYIGEYTNFDLATNGTSPGMSIQECLSNTMSTNINITYNLTSFGNVGEYIDINFEGTYLDDTDNSHTISGVIHVLRDN